MEAMDNQRML